MEQAKVGDISGVCALRSNLSLEEVAKIISDKIFGGLPFEGKEECIHEEIPAVFIKGPVLGLLVILSGYSGYDKDKCFVLYVQPWGDFDRYLFSNKIETERVNLDNYLYHLLDMELRGVEEIQVVALES